MELALAVVLLAGKLLGPKLLPAPIIAAAPVVAIEEDDEYVENEEEYRAAAA